MNLSTGAFWCHHIRDLEARKSYDALVSSCVCTCVHVSVCARGVCDMSGRDMALPVHHPTLILFSTGDMGDKGQKGSVGRHGKIGPIGSKGISDALAPRVPS